MDYKHAQHYTNKEDEPRTKTRPGLYVAVSGNTGSGKSTLVKAVVESAQLDSISAIAIDERSLHHPLLPLMFSRPSIYAFAIQVNFLLQRHLMLLKWMETDSSIVIERSHLDDVLFVEHLKERGDIDAEEYGAYISLSEVLHRKIRLPDIFVCLEVEPHISLARIAAQEQKSERPKEFPDELTKSAFVLSWYQRYATFHDAIAEKAESDAMYRGMTVLRFRSDKDISTAANEIRDEMRRLLST